MRILIVDDTAKNLEASKQASVNFPEHEFLFTNSAEEALVKLSDADAIITDLFFPDECHREYVWERRDFIMTYNDFYRKLSALNRYTTLFQEVLQQYYHGNIEKAEEEHLAALDIVSEGNIRESMERRHWIAKRNGKDTTFYRAYLSNLPPSQFPYGAALMLKAKELGKKHCLISDIHGHATGYENTSSSVDGVSLLLPLIEASIISIEQAKYDGGDSLTYLGGDKIRRIGKGKNDPVVWAEVIRQILAQPKERR